MTLEERVVAVERELAHQNEMRSLREINDKLAVGRAERADAQFNEFKKALPNLQAAMKELEDASIVTATQAGRHETRIKEHQRWQEDMELAFARMAKAHAEFDENMTRVSAAQLVTEEKLQGLIDALSRGTNGHN